MIKYFVINKISKKVLRHGFCDFALQEDFNSETENVIEIDLNTEGLIEANIDFNPGIHEQDWYWNETTGEFQITPIT